MTKTATPESWIAGPAGRIQTQIDQAQIDPLGAKPARKGVAILAHPHPLYGGNMNNKVVHTLAKAFTGMGWQAVRFNFRGIGASEGDYDEGVGETDDLLAVIQAYAASGPFCLAGFSFGTMTITHALARLAANGRDLNADVQRIALIGAAAGRFSLAPIAPQLHHKTLVLHAEADDTVPLAAVMDWARPQSLPVTVVPEGSHFFHGQLPLLKNLVMRHLA